MFVEVGCIVAGIPVGLAVRRSATIVRAVDRLTMWAIYCLLFLLGAALGSDANLMAQIQSIGLRAAVISVCCLLGSASAVWLLDTFILRGSLDER